jgi:sensor histidine kinase YesM
MRPEWKRFWQETRRYLVYVPIGALISLIPFILNIGEYKKNQVIVSQFFLFLAFGLTISLVVMAFISSAYALLTLVYIKTKLQLWGSTFLQIAIAVVGTVLGIWSTLSVRAYFAGESLERPAFFAVLIFGSIIAMVFFLYSAYQDARQDRLALQAAVAEARYQSLEHQMRPHFLFNALNSLAELIEAGHENSAKMTQTLADLYRQILTNSATKTAPLKSEIDIARRYLEIEKLRFGRRLNYSIHLLLGADALYLPSLVTQTLVENAVKHGIAKSLDGGEILIEVEKAKDYGYQLSVTNTGAPFSNDNASGTGLANTRARLDLLYGHHHQFQIVSDESGITTVAFNFTGERID